MLTVFVKSKLLSGKLTNVNKNDEEEEDIYKYVAKQDVIEFQKLLKVFGKEYGKSWTVIPDGEGLSQLALLEAPEHVGRADMRYELNEMPDAVKLFLYTR